VVSVSREFGFDMGHCLPEHDGACYRPHGHRYTLRVTLEGEVIGEGPSTGMVMDFARFKALVDDFVVGHYDHRFAMYVHDPRFDAALVAFNNGILPCMFTPTVENLAREIADTIGQVTADYEVRVREVLLWETPTCSATWTPCE
jgi:6-pyruvoyltetrahydropterin/6-carboxytetrahydropterin synthase